MTGEDIRNLAMQSDERSIIISHSHNTATNSSIKWDILSRSEQMQYYSRNDGNNLLAICTAPGIIELWDMTSTPVALSYLSAPSTRSMDDHLQKDCLCIAWSHCQSYLGAVFEIRNSSSTDQNRSVFYLWDVILGVIITSYKLVHDFFQLWFNSKVIE